MSWQKCPVCRGVGTVSGGYFSRAGDYPSWASFTALEVCQVCKGKGIIDEITGLPPVFKKEVKDE
mgnify:FL=1